MKRVYSFFYDLFLCLAFLVALPRILYKMVVFGKYKKSLSVRFGFSKPHVGQKGPVVWFHGASVGEVTLLSPILQRFRKEFPEWHCVVTACSEAGVQTAERLYAPLGATVFVLPLDLSLIIKPFVYEIAPSLLVFSEGDCWFNFLSAAKKVGAKAVVVNGKMSSRSCGRFSCIKRLGRDYFSSIDQFFLQDSLYKQRFLELGVADSKIKVTGNIKTYVEPILDEEPVMKRRERLHIPISSKLLVLGSVHPKDFMQWIPVLQQKEFHDVFVLWVPRHPERVPILKAHLERAGMHFSLWSEAPYFSHRSLIVDQVGLLKRCYGIADLAFVGGTFDEKVGGHNLLEPLQAGVPVLFGPHVYSQSELASRLLANGAGVCVHNQQELSQVALDLLFCDTTKQDLIDKGQLFLEKEGGALNRTWEELKHYITCEKM